MEYCIYLLIALPVLIVLAWVIRCNFQRRLKYVYKMNGGYHYAQHKRYQYTFFNKFNITLPF